MLIASIDQFSGRMPSRKRLSASTRSMLNDLTAPLEPRPAPLAGDAVMCQCERPARWVRCRERVAALAPQHPRPLRLPAREVLVAEVSAVPGRIAVLEV